MQSILLAFSLYFVSAYSVDVPPCPKYPLQNFTQTLDHNSSTAATFQQKYQLDTSRFKPGGPILFLQGSESAVFPCLEYHHYDDIAEELGAIVCVIQHRFFGDSFPAGVFEENATATDFAPLTLDNVLLDSVELLKWVKSTVPGAAESKVIVNGGSYGGFLATMARVKYPESFFGSWPSAPYLKSWGPLENNTDKYNWWDWVANVYQDESATASQKISQALYQFNECAYSDTGCSSVLSSLNLCTPGPENKTDWVGLYRSNLHAYEWGAQFSFGIPGLFPVAHPLPYIVNHTLALNDSGSILRFPLMLLNGQLDMSKCLNWTSTNLTGASTGIQFNSFDWVQCNFYPSTSDAIREGSMFPPFETTGRIDSCPYPEWMTDLYNSTNEAVINEYGLTAENLERLGRFLFVQGGSDPTSSDGPPPFPISALRNATRTRLMPGVGHTEDSNANILEPEGLNPNLDALQNIITQTIKEWLL